MDEKKDEKVGKKDEENEDKRKENKQGAQLSVVVSNLPVDVTIKQIIQFCSRVGVIGTHPDTGDDLILLNKMKKKAIVTYVYPEAANKAIEVLNNELFNDKVKVVVERALREPFDINTFKSSMKMSRKFHSNLGGEEELGTEELKRLRIMVLKNVFQPNEMIKDPMLYGKIIKELTDVCSKFGKVTLVKPFENNVEGKCIVRFDDSQSCSIAVGDMDNTEIRGRIVSAEIWDGKNIVSAKETEEEYEERIKRFHDFQNQKKDSKIDDIDKVEEHEEQKS